jgi:hypothetical protein
VLGSILVAACRGQRRSRYQAQPLRLQVPRAPRSKRPRERRRREGDATARGAKALKGSKPRRASGRSIRWKHRRSTTDSRAEQGPEGERRTSCDVNDTRATDAERLYGCARGEGSEGRNPTSACRVKQTGGAERGESRQEREKRCRRKGRGCGKPMTVSVASAATTRKGLARYKALKGVKPHERCCSVTSGWSVQRRNRAACSNGRRETPAQLLRLAR